MLYYVKFILEIFIYDVITKPERDRLKQQSHLSFARHMYKTKVNLYTIERV